jgi:hypothetical protein
VRATGHNHNCLFDKFDIAVFKKRLIWPRPDREEKMNKREFDVGKEIKKTTEGMIHSMIFGGIILLIVLIALWKIESVRAAIIYN